MTSPALTSSPLSLICVRLLDISLYVDGCNAVCNTAPSRGRTTYPYPLLATSLAIFVAFFAPDDKRPALLNEFIMLLVTPLRIALSLPPRINSRERRRPNPVDASRPAMPAEFAIPPVNRNSAMNPSDSAAVIPAL